MKAAKSGDVQAAKLILERTSAAPTNAAKALTLQHTARRLGLNVPGDTRSFWSPAGTDPDRRAMNVAGVAILSGSTEEFCVIIC